MINRVKIGDKFISHNDPVYVIADMGSNHDNKLSQAISLIDIAAESKVDAVKLQLYYGEGLWPKKSTAYPILKSLETNREWIDALQEHADKCNITLLATPFDYDAVDILNRINSPAFKWASSEIFDIPLIEYASKFNKPMIMSTGVCDMSDIQKAMDAVYKHNNEEIVLLHCVSAYPTEPKDSNLRMMDTIKNAFHVPVGLSDHSLGTAIPLAAVARGACLIEKHFTISRDYDGLDHKFALEPKELSTMVKEIRDVEASLGSPVKKIIKGAEDASKIIRLFANQDILAGTKITKKMITVKRDEFGLMPEYHEIVIGREAKKDIENDTPITWDKI